MIEYGVKGETMKAEEKKKTAPKKTAPKKTTARKKTSAAPAKSVSKKTSAPSKKVSSQAGRKSVIAEGKAAKAKASAGKTMQKETSRGAGKRQPVPAKTVKKAEIKKSKAPARQSKKPAAAAKVKTAVRKPAERKAVKSAAKSPVRPSVAVGAKKEKTSSRPAGKAVAAKTKKPESASRKSELKTTTTSVGKKAAKTSSPAVAVEKTRTMIASRKAAAEKPAKRTKRSALPVRAQEKTVAPAAGSLRGSMPFAREAAGKSPEVPKVKIFLPNEGDEDLQDFSEERFALPAEYGENELLIMVVDPRIIFANWEVIPSAWSEGPEGFVLRVYDISGICFDGSNARRSMDIQVQGRTGSGFFDIGMPGSEVVVEIGFITGNEFRPLIRSNVVSLPCLLVPDELGIVAKLSVSGVPIGY